MGKRKYNKVRKEKSMFQYLFWHYTEGLKDFPKTWKNFLRFFWYFFSIEFLFETLFYHWHRDITTRGPGFDLKEFFQTLVFNILSRGIGAIVRTITILAGLLICGLVLIAGAFLFLVWLAFPAVVLGLFLGGLILISSSPIGGISMIIAAGFLAYSAYTLFLISKRKLPSEMSFEEMIKQPWFDLAWERMGINPSEGRMIPFQSILGEIAGQGLSNEDFNEVVKWVVFIEEEKERKKKFWAEENLFRFKGIGKDWAYGYTNHLDNFSVEHNRSGKGAMAGHLIGREREIEAIERVLARSDENNVLLVGDPGTGKKSIVRKIAELAFQGRTLAPLQHKRVLELDVGAVMSGASSSSEMEDKLRMILNEAVAAGNIILIINDFHNFIGDQIGLGKVNISGVLLPYLNSRYLQIVALTTHEGLHKKIEKDSGLMKFFEKVEVAEPDEKNDMLILQDVVPQFEARTKIRATYAALKEIVAKSIQYPSDVPMPERAIDLLEEAMIFAATKTKDGYLSKKHVDLILSEKIKIPVGDASEEEKDKLVNLEESLHHRVIGQDEAVREISSAMRRARAGISDKSRPVGSFLFLGPTGVGKTETAKALAEAYFGNEKVMVRLDMSEYQNLNDISRLIGSPDGEPGFLTTQIRENPFSVFLLDEIEKAHPNILNLFLQVLDEGFMTDGWGRKINFKNSIVIATSNGGAELIRQMVEQGFDPNTEKEKVMDYLQKENIFKPEFLNRFDGVIIFHPLTKRELLKVAKLMLDSLNRRLAEKKITLGITSELLEKIVELGYNPEYGARPMRRVIQDKIEDLISKKILENSAGAGSIIEINAEEIQ
jgi:ATP-dependent Clp protease ATP-binding subunit ClpC